MKNLRFVELDVHAEPIAVAVAESGGEVRSLGVIPNRAESVGRLMRKLGKPEQLRVCYEAGPTGDPRYWQLTQMGVKCEVVALTLVPVKAGDRVKTDRRDAERLARCYRAGDLTAVWVPDAAHEVCEIWCGRARRPKPISCAPGIGSRRFCCAMAGAPRKALGRGRVSTGIGLRAERISSSRRRRRLSSTMCTRYSMPLPASSAWNRPSMRRWQRYRRRCVR